MSESRRDLRVVPWTIKRPFAETPYFFTEQATHKRRSADMSRGPIHSRGGSGHLTTPNPLPPRADVPVQNSAKKLPLFTEDGKAINKDLCDSLAWKQIQMFLDDTDRGRVRQNSMTQVRRFFGEMKGLYNRVRNGESYARIFPLIKMMKSKAAYASGRNTITYKFKDFIFLLVDSVTEEERTFEAVMLHFEAVFGFFYGERGLAKQ